MRLITPYAPPTFHKPCLIVSTAFTNCEKDTAIKFIDALNTEKALSYCFSETEVRAIEKITKKQISTNWIIIKSHRNVGEAVGFHLKLTTKITEASGDEVNGKGYGQYLKLYKKYCPFKINED